MPDRKPYTHVHLYHEEEPLRRYEVRVSIFIEYDEDAGRRAVTHKPTKEQALKQAKAIAKSERIRTGGGGSP